MRTAPSILYSNVKICASLSSFVLSAVSDDICRKKEIREALYVLCRRVIHFVVRNARSLYK